MKGRSRSSHKVRSKRFLWLHSYSLYLRLRIAFTQENELYCTHYITTGHSSYEEVTTWTNVNQPCVNKSPQRRGCWVFEHH